MEIKLAGTDRPALTVALDETTLAVTVRANDAVWETDAACEPCVKAGGEAIPFTRWQQIHHEYFKNGVGKGIHSSYRALDGREASYEFDTVIFLDETAGTVRFEWIPICEEGLSVEEVNWPAAFEFEAQREDWYTLINEGQGLMIPNDWPTALGKLSFEGRFLTSGGYMPWFGQVKERHGYVAVCVTPWNAGVHAKHPAGGPFTRIGLWWEPSLGKMDYRRIVEYHFLENCDYNDLCKVYRTYVKETGHFTSLREKAARCPSVEKLAGCSFVHTGTKTHVNPLSEFYDKENPDKNNHLTRFEDTEKLVEEIHRIGAKKVYLHLDGWGQPGYDNQHPDYLPACEEAGGYEGMKHLADTMHRLGYLFGIHDQYRDYYLDASTYDPQWAVQLPDGVRPQHARWAGGPQNYLCATQAPAYVRRNFTELLSHGVSLDGAYLDVFTCNEGDECANPAHRMSRRECYEYRRQCFDWLLARGILTSSEEVSDWSMRSLVFCHYAPYTFQLKHPKTPREGIALPLFNLVYHDCVVEPWMMDKVETENGEEDYMLYALLNGGAPYLIRDGAYAGTDGSFSESARHELAEANKRCQVAAALHERVAMSEMIRHELLDSKGRRQRTVFADGTVVEVNLDDGSYKIETV